MTAGDLKGKALEGLLAGRLKAAFIPSRADRGFAITRLRGEYVCEALRKLGVSAELASPESACSFDVAVIGGKHDAMKDCLETLALLNAKGVKAVFDFDFALELLQSQLSREAFVSFLGHCQAVSASAIGLCEACEGWTGTPVLHVDDTVDNASSRGAAPKRRLSGPALVGWTGLPGNLESLFPLFPLFEELHRRRPGSLKLSFLSSVKTNSRRLRFESTEELLKACVRVPFEFREWKAESCAEEAARWDLAVCSCFTKVPKSCNRALLAGFAGALPVASRTKDNESALKDLAPELLCAGFDDWLSVLERASVDEDWRLALAEKVQAGFKARFSAEALAKRWLELLAEALSKPLPEKPFAPA